MYSLDVNFLKDRPDYAPQTGKGTRPDKKPLSGATKTPLYLGVAIGIFIPAVVVAWWLLLQQQTSTVQQRQAELEAELGRLKGIEEQLQKLNGETTQVAGETTALASVFNQIKPWSAMLQDLRERIPPGVQIKTIQQTAAAPAAAPAAPSPSPSPGAPAAAATPSAPLPTSKLSIRGIARSFNDVNDFLLTLQGSPFFKGKETQLVSAKLVENPIAIEAPKAESGANTTGVAEPTVTVKLPQVVEYEIQTNLTDVPASELIRELDRKGAVGLVTRLRTLQEKGVLQR